MPKPELDYLQNAVPEPGQLVPLVDGIYWIRMPLPMALNHINLWLLEDADGWNLVDTGVNTLQTRTLWDGLLAGPLADKPLKQIIVTHMHPDHVGMAGWLVARTGARFMMSRTDYLMCRMLCADNPGEPPAVALDFYRAAGFDETALADYSARFGGFGSSVAGLPLSYQRLQDGQHLALAGYDWRLIEGRGHAPEHICLLAEAESVFISGDQLLPTISSNISVWPTEPNANPLIDWLESCADLNTQLAEDTLILPSHGKPFRGAQTRLDWLIEHHQQQLKQVADACHEPATVREIIPAMFSRPLKGFDLVMATGEALAHINYLLETGELVAGRANGVTRYQRKRAV